MVRVAGLKRRIAAGLAVTAASGIMPRDLHDMILTRVREMVTDQARVFAEDVRPALAEEGIQIVAWEELTDEEVGRMATLMEERILPILTPLAVDPSHPFPYISGLSVNLAILLQNPVTGAKQFARVKLPTNVPRFIRLDETRFLPLEEVIGHNLDMLFSGMRILQWTTFRVTRNEDLEVEEDDAENILAAIERTPQPQDQTPSSWRWRPTSTSDAQPAYQELDISPRGVPAASRST